MSAHRLTCDQIAAFAEQLKSEERAAATIEKYLRTMRRFAVWLGGSAVTQQQVS